MFAFFALQILSELEKILLILCCFCNTFFDEHLPCNNNTNPASGMQLLCKTFGIILF